MKKLSKKNFTKLLNPGYRKSILEELKTDDIHLKEYATLLVNDQILHRNKEFENDKDSFYGFSPLGVLGAVNFDNSVSTRIFELNIVNHFLKELNGFAAIEVVMCLLLMWKMNDRNIKNFNPEIIEIEMKKLDEEYAKQEELRKQKEEKENKND